MRLQASSETVQNDPSAAKSPICQAEWAQISLHDVSGVMIETLEMTGGLSHVTVDMRSIARLILATAPHSLVIAHYHPSGDPSPSAADIASTREIAAFVKMFGVFLHDHRIESAGRVFSFRDVGLL